MRIAAFLSVLLLVGCVQEVKRDSKRLLFIGLGVLYTSERQKDGEYDPSQAITDLNVDFDPTTRSGSIKIERNVGGAQETPQS